MEFTTTPRTFDREKSTIQVDISSQKAGTSLSHPSDSIPLKVPPPPISRPEVSVPR